MYESDTDKRNPTCPHWFSSIKQGFSLFSNHVKFDLKVKEGFVWLARISHIFAFETSVWAVFNISIAYTLLRSGSEWPFDQA